MNTRERLWLEGASGLGDADLLALVLETGSAGRSALRTAAELLDQVGTLRALRSMQPHEWLGVRGIGPARAVRISAALELGRRAAVSQPLAAPVADADAAFHLLGPGLRGLDHEELHALYLDRRHRPLARRCLTRGNDALTVVDPRQIFRVAVGLGAHAVILAHNHPSGDPTPSGPDRAVTGPVARAGQLLGIVLLDHLVVGADRYVSIGGPWPASSVVPLWTG